MAITNGKLQKYDYTTATYVNEPPWNSSSFSLPARARDAKSYDIHMCTVLTL